MNAQMRAALVRDAHAVLFPVISDLRMPEWLESALGAGTRGFVLGETRDEYVAREMSARRQREETPGDVRQLVDAARAVTGGELLVAVDHEPWGTRRLQHLAPQVPSVEDDTDVAVVEQGARDFAEAARGMGVTAVLAPVVDRLTGTNPWLTGRTLDASPRRIGEMAAAFVAGVQSGGVVAFVKHFPGFPEVSGDPAQEVAHVPVAAWSTEHLDPFRSCLDAGAVGVMTGPAVVIDVDASEPSSTSAATVGLLRRDLGFTGLVLSDNLEAPATSCGRSVSETAVAAIDSGVELLLVADGAGIVGVVDGLVTRAVSDPEFARKLGASAAHVRQVVADLAP